MPPLNFEDCQVEDVSLPKHLVQIGVDETEVNRRVSCFVERKREEIDINNIKDFIGDNELKSTETEYSCARVNSSVYGMDSGTHLKGNNSVFSLANDTMYSHAKTFSASG